MLQKLLRGTGCRQPGIGVNKTKRVNYFDFAYLIGQPQNKWVVESNNLLGLHSCWIQHVTAPTLVTCWIRQPTCILHSSFAGRAFRPPAQEDSKMHIGWWTQQVFARVGAVTCWI